MRHVALPTLFHTLRQNGGRLLGLDLGDRYVGVAVSDPACAIALPHSVLILKSSTPFMTVNALDELVRKYSVSGIVVGYPLALAGLRRQQAVNVDYFIKDLEWTGRFENLCCFYEDERFTSKTCILAFFCRLYGM
eukprot:c23427_g1_i2 orf=192-596(+)